MRVDVLGTELTAESNRRKKRVAEPEMGLAEQQQLLVIN